VAKRAEGVALPLIREGYRSRHRAQIGGRWRGGPNSTRRGRRFDAEARPLGAKGLGELTAVSVAPAIANAIYHATGKRVRDLPITMEKLLLLLDTAARTCEHKRS
jgi:hypothetical protein